jgi:putative tricarboxylic transport membrane protein
VAQIVVLFWMSAICCRIGGMLISPFFIKILSSPRELILPVAAGLGVLGSWAAGFTLFDVYSMLLFGVLGFFLRLKDYPLAPMVLGILVGKIADTSLRRALLTYSADIFGMLTRPFSIVLLLFLIFTIVTQIRAMMKTRKKKTAPPEPAADDTYTENNQGNNNGNQNQG